jgi:hypothetical protein
MMIVRRGIGFVFAGVLLLAMPACSSTDTGAEEDEACEEGYTLTDAEKMICEPADTSHHDAQEQLLACEVDEPCAPSSLENGVGTYAWEGGDCLLKALRDRTPGRYAHRNKQSDIGVWITDYHLIVESEGSLQVAKSSTIIDSRTTMSYDPVQRCQLKSEADLNDCVDAGTDIGEQSTTGGDENALPICDAVSDWYTDCEDVQAIECPDAD